MGFDSHPSIVMLYPFFGKTPWYFKYFVDSARFNPSIFFIVFMEEMPFENIPPNMQFVQMNLSEFQVLAADRLNLPIQVEPTPFKLCDFRPAFGYIFDEYIRGFDFWGHGDLDVIFGNVRNFLSTEVLLEYDIISAHPYYISSWFCIYRNSPKVNSLFMLSHDYVKVFTTATYYNFDEVNFRFFEFSETLDFRCIHTDIESITQTIKRFSALKTIQAYFELHAIEGLSGKILWQKGTLLYRNKFELLLYHLLELKRIYKDRSILERKNLESIRISKTRIYNKLYK